MRGKSPNFLKFVSSSLALRGQMEIFSVGPNGLIFVEGRIECSPVGLPRLLKVKKIIKHVAKVNSTQVHTRTEVCII